MLKFFERDDVCDVILDPPLLHDDTLSLENLFKREYISWNITFGRVYNIDVKMVMLLSEYILHKQQSIHLKTHKNKLNRYLYRLGFDTNFESLIKNDVVDIDSIEIILIGGSADSSEKIIEIVKNIDLKNLSLIVVQHVDSAKNAIFDKILQDNTKHKVSYASNSQKLQKSNIYLAVADKHLEYQNNSFVLSSKEKYNLARPSISISYESFSEYYKEKLLVIQECGYVNDGVDKLKLLKKNKSKIIIQNSDECEAKSMPLEALKEESENYTFDLQNIIYYLKLLNIDDEAKLLLYLKNTIYEIYSYDFRGYHQDMFKRRIDVFMLKHNIKKMKDAVGLILFNRSAFKGFFLEISINVTEFFRKPESFSGMLMFFNKYYKKNLNLKIWSAGCSSGEEAYSMAIMLDFLNLLEKTTIYATDFNSVILEEAKNAIYSKDSYKKARNNLFFIDSDKNLDEYIDKYNDFIIINEKIRKKVLFFQHNLVLDGSFNEFDIIICKNVIIYFEETLQERVFQLFYDSLKFGANLILGESENIHPSFISKFEQSNENLKIFKKVA